MDSPQPLSSFVARRITVGRVQPGANYFYMPYYAVPHELPTIEKIAQDLTPSFRVSSSGTGSIARAAK